MIILAIVRVSGIHMKQQNSVDIVWDIFWLEVEAAIAVIMVSITEFRSLLGMKAREKRERYWLDSRRPKMLARYFKKSTPNEFELADLPYIPGATLTGMRTVIHGTGVWEDSRTINHEPHEIKVTHQLSTDSEILKAPKPVSAGNFV